MCRIDLPRAPFRKTGLGPLRRGLHFVHLALLPDEVGPSGRPHIFGNLLAQGIIPPMLVRDEQAARARGPGVSGPPAPPRPARDHRLAARNGLRRSRSGLRSPVGTSRPRCERIDPVRRAPLATTLLALVAAACPASPPARHADGSGSASSQPAATSRPTPSRSPAAWLTYHADAARTGVDSSSPRLGSAHRAWPPPERAGAVS